MVGYLWTWPVKPYPFGGNVLPIQKSSPICRFWCCSSKGNWTTTLGFAGHSWPDWAPHILYQPSKLTPLQLNPSIWCMILRQHWSLWQSAYRTYHNIIDHRLSWNTHRAGRPQWSIDSLEVVQFVMALLNMHLIVVLVEIRWHKRDALGVIHHVVMPVVCCTQCEVNYSYENVILNLCSNK